MAKGMTVAIAKGILTITIPVEKVLNPSASGKTLRVASTEGNAKTDVEVEGKPLFIGLNAYIRNS